MRWMWDAQDLWIDPERLAAAGRANRIEGTAGDDRLAGTDARDRFDLADGGNDRARGGDGNDAFDFGAAFTSADVLDPAATASVRDGFGDPRRSACELEAG